MFEQTVEALKQRGFEVEAVATKQEALALVMKEAESAASVGWGGSESVKEIGARARLVESGKEIRDHQLVCDLFLLSANAESAHNAKTSPATLIPFILPS